MIENVKIILKEMKIINVHVKPNSPKNEIVSFENDILKVNIKAVPDKGKANAELVKFFSKKLGKKIEIISGKTSRKKRIKIIQNP